MQVKNKGKQYYLWRAVDKNGQVVDILMQSRRDRRAVDKFFRKLLKSQGLTPRVV
ncbi:MAG: DDE-type integrase/transposase/recombinase, partial [Synechococcus sp.]